MKRKIMSFLLAFVVLIFSIKPFDVKAEVVTLTLGVFAKYVLDSAILLGGAMLVADGIDRLNRGEKITPDFSYDYSSTKSINYNDIKTKEDLLSLGLTVNNVNSISNAYDSYISSPTSKVSFDNLSGLDYKNLSSSFGYSFYDIIKSGECTLINLMTGLYEGAKRSRHYIYFYEPTYKRYTVHYFNDFNFIQLPSGMLKVGVYGGVSSGYSFVRKSGYNWEQGSATVGNVDYSIYIDTDAIISTNYEPIRKYVKPYGYSTANVPVIGGLPVSQDRDSFPASLPVGGLNIPNVYNPVLDGVSQVEGVIIGGIKDGSISLDGSIDDVLNPPISPPVDNTGIIQKILNAIRDMFDWFTGKPSVSVNFKPLQVVDISDRFPFCLPFDLINSIRSFASPPVVPSWSFNFGGMGLVGGDKSTLNIDLSDYQKIADIIRYFVGMMFVVGLIKITKNISQG